MAVTDEELEQKRQRVAKLREQIASAQAKQAERVRAQENEIEAAQLDAEAARLEAELSATQEAAKVASVKEGASTPLAKAKEQLKVAQAQKPAADNDKE